MEVQPLPGEYWASWVSRRFRLEGYLTQAEGIACIPCAGDMGRNFHAPSVIELKALFGQQSLQSSLREFLEQHTGMLAQMPTLADEMRKLDRNRARELDGLIRQRVANDILRWGLLPTPKLCPQCALANSRDDQVAYFHTAHQFAFAAVCAQHHAPLIALNEVWRLNSAFPNARIISDLVEKANESRLASGYDEAIQAALKLQSAGTFQLGESMTNRPKDTATATKAPTGADRLQVKRISLVGLAKEIDRTSRKLRLFSQFKRLPVGTAPLRAKLLLRRPGHHAKYSATLAALVRSVDKR